MPEASRLLAEAFRVLRPSGQLAAFDGDYSTITVAGGAGDPLQTCVEAFAGTYITDRWVVRRLPALVRDAGFERAHFRSHGFVEVSPADYMLSIVDRGADALAADGGADQALAEALKAEARRRVDAGAFFGHVAYASLTATKLSAEGGRGPRGEAGNAERTPV